MQGLRSTRATGTVPRLRSDAYKNRLGLHAICGTARPGDGKIWYWTLDELAGIPT
jgi:hypothetical protein